ncbi:hypothetical protein O0L34_g5892 [Tuta absoluta]|nr:hypothetical protein O0L34_g5892 [Tuta absoluta]
MDERKILLFVLSLVVYCLYSVQMWYTKDVSDTKTDVSKETVKAEPNIDLAVIVNNITEEPKHVKVKTKVIPLYLKNACSILEVFTKKPPVKCKETKNDVYTDTNTVTVLGITIFLLVLIINAVLDVLKVQEEERLKRKLNPDGERRQSLAEFANKKVLRRESSRFGFNLFQISEQGVNTSDEKNKTERQTRTYRRGDSINSYLSDRKVQNDNSTPTSAGDPSEPKLAKRQSVAKLFGARPVPMVRRSSFPALPLNPDVQAAMLGHRQQSVDSDDEDGRGRRVRLIRRF